MKSRIPLVAIMALSFAATARVDGGNDTFAQRKVLPSLGTVEEEIARTAEVSYEPLDPVPPESVPGDSIKNGTLWWEWMAPADGWFTAGTLMNDGFGSATFVFTGDRMENLMPVQNGNFLGLNNRKETIFEAKQGKIYHLVVRIAGMTATAPAGNPAGGILRVWPSPSPPGNDTLATRRVLPSTVPFQVTGTNLTGPTGEGRLFFQMTALPGLANQFWPPGTVQWWEWTCPETGDYAMHVSEEAAISVAVRQQTAGGTSAPAGQWEANLPGVKDNRFHALAGRVYDIAVMAARGWDFSGTNSYGEYTLGMTKVAAVATAPNTTRESATPMPATLPSEVTLEWPGQSKDDLEPVRLWWKFTAPSRGIYAITASAANFQVHYQPGRRWIGSKVPLLDAGETVLIEHFFHRPAPRKITTRVELLGVPGNNDMVAQATDLGTARDFYLYGDGSQATLEPGEANPILIPAAGALPGTLWWKWTAPENGWLRIRSDVFPVPLKLFPGANPVGQQVTLNGPIAVQQGTPYLIRAGFENDVTADVCAMRLDLLPAVTNLTWQTARDLGVTRSPQWNPPGRSPQVNLNAKQWFRWTAAETGDYALTDGGDGEVFTSPEENRQLWLNPISETYRLEAGRTYWMRTGTINSGAWFELLPEPLTANGDPSTAMVVSTILPAAATAPCRGDENSAFEVVHMKELVSENDLRDGTPVIWYKWQPQTTQRVRAHAENLSEWASEVLVIFSGDFPDVKVEEEYARYDNMAHYFKAVADTTYWFAVAAVNRFATERTAIRLELWPVTEVPPPNDLFTNSRKIENYPALNDWGTTVVHYGAPGVVNPVRWEWAKATMEPGEPPVHLIDDDNGNIIKQTATTWFNWTAPAAGIFQFTVRTRPEGPRNVRGGSDPYTPLDLTADLYTGGNLLELSPVPMYEPLNGRYFFRAAKDQRYHIRAASGDRLQFYEFLFLPLTMMDVYDFAAIEESRFEDVGHSWESNAGDRIPNVYKFLFGLNPDLPLDHPDNLLLSDRLPRQVPGQAGVLEMRCRPDPRFLAEGNPAAFILPGLVSSNLADWEHITPMTLSNGEVAIRHPGDTPAGFLQWDVLPAVLDD